MRMNLALAEGRTAVITGAANGIGLAAAKAFARLGMKVCLADLPGERLQNAEAEVVREAEGWAERVRAIPTDVSRLEDGPPPSGGGVRRLRRDRGPDEQCRDRRRGRAVGAL
jgi:NAD(P)-dependent dehydrogenase (short-subunit alcohol dehydrogenase family)